MSGEGENVGRHVAGDFRLPVHATNAACGEHANAGLVGREPGSKRYACSERMNGLAVETLLRSPARGARRAVLEELVEQVGETCNLTIPNNNSVLYLDRVEASWPLRVRFTAGSKLPLYASASGKLFLSYLPKRSRERFLRVTPLIRHTHKTFTDPARLGREFEAIRANGYAADDEEYLAGVCCLAVPVRDADQRVVAAISVQAPVTRMRLEEMVEFLPHLRQAAEQHWGPLREAGLEEHPLTEAEHAEIDRRLARYRPLPEAWEGNGETTTAATMPRAT
jgi:DNA-binding IclR family transcriptional regulator